MLSSKWSFKISLKKRFKLNAEPCFFAMICGVIIGIIFGVGMRSLPEDKQLDALDIVYLKFPGTMLLQGQSGQYFAPFSYGTSIQTVVYAEFPAFYKSKIQGCVANSAAGNSDDLGNSDDFLGKSLKLIFVRFSTFFQFLTT